MKITSVENKARRKAFEIKADGHEWSFPYAKLRLQPTSDDPVATVEVDPELGNEAFTYRLASGAEDSVHLDAVRDANRDPDFLQALLLHRLTVEARRAVDESDMGVRQMARQLGTSPSQLYRLLDPANTGKSLGQMLALLNLTDRDVSVTVTPKDGPAQPPIKFEVYRDKAGGYRFRLKNSAGRVILSSHPYQSKRSCMKGIGAIRKYSKDRGAFSTKKTASGYRFAIKAKNHQVIGRSPVFTSPASRDRALTTVLRKAETVELVEPT